MKTALVILILLLIACLLGSIIPQGENRNYYLSSYQESLAHGILALALDDVFHAWWFIAIAAFLCVNLLGCNLLRFPGLIKRTKEGFTPQKRCSEMVAGEAIEYSGDAEKLFCEMGFQAPVSVSGKTGEKGFYAVRHKAGLWGAWLTHLGILIIILGFSLGQIFTEKESVYGVPGQTKEIPGTNYSVTINQFETALREDETVEQYTATVTLTDNRTGEQQSGKVSVNHPLRLFGMKLYQNSTGWAADVLLYNNDELEQCETLCAGEIFTVQSKPKLQMLFSAFYPDYIAGENGMPETASSLPNNPAYLYSLFYDENMIGMNILKDGEYISVDDYSFLFASPQQYTLIQLKKDPFTFLVLVGGILICAALVFAFYIRTEELLVLGSPEDQSKWQVFGFSRKGGVLYKEKLKNKIESLEEKADE